MRLVLDTHALIWLVHAPERLGSAATDAVTAPDAVVLASHVSLGEMAIKRRLGKLDGIDRPAMAWFTKYVPDSGLHQLPIEARHLGAVESLPLLHGDPFDRLLIAQTLQQGATIVTCDDLVSQYDVASIW